MRVIAEYIHILFITFGDSFVVEHLQMRDAYLFPDLVIACLQADDNVLYCNQQSIKVIT